MVRMRELLDSFFSSLQNKVVEYGLDSIIKNINGIDDKIKCLKINTNSLIAKASYVEEQLKNAELSGRKKRKREVEDWLKEVKEIENEYVILSSEEQGGGFPGFISWFLGGDKVTRLYAIVTALLEQSQHFGELAVDDYETKGRPLLTCEMFGQAFDEKLNWIVKCLVDDKVKAIGIYGMGGVGKTTLAQHVHNRLLNEPQYSVYWITVSQEFSIKKLQDDIGKLIGLNLSDEENEVRRAAMLNRALSRVKKCVLVLDDVWEEFDLEKIGDPLLVEGCRLILTARSLEVCCRIGCEEKIEVKPLERNVAWNLFKAKLGHFMELDPDVQEIAMLVAKQCDGLPLGIVTLAKTMRGVTSIHEWKNALEELKASSCMTQLNNMEEKVFGVLQYSYDRLDPKLKACLLYCCLYPEDRPILRIELISHFISEGLMDKQKSRSSQYDLGHAMLNKLVNHCLLEKVVFDCVKMHDLVRDMALKIARNSQRFMVLAGLSLEKISSEEEWSKDLEKVSLMENKIKKIPSEMAPNCPKLTTLLLNRNNHLDFIPESFFVHMRSLRTLDLSFCGSMEELPNSLSDLESLNALILRGCRKLKHVPYLGKLKALTELNLSETALENLPQGMECLINLKAFYSQDMRYLQMLPTSLLHEFPNLRSIQCLYLPEQMKIKMEDIEQLKDLEEFRGVFEDVRDFNQFSKSREHNRHPHIYSVRVGKFHFDGLELYEADYDRKVRMRGFDFKREEGEGSFIILPQDLQLLEIGDCQGGTSFFSDDFPILNVSRSLCYLSISYCKEIEYIWRRNDMMMVEEQHCHINELHLYHLPDFVGVINWEVGAQSLNLSHFLSLRTLVIGKCDKIKKLGLPLACFQNIKYISVYDCEAIEEIIEVAENESGGIISLPNLEELSLCSLPNLKSICNGATLISCESVENIELQECPNMKKLPLFLYCSEDNRISYPPPALKEIEVDYEWWESLVWEQLSHKHSLQPFLKFY